MKYIHSFSMGTTADGREVTGYTLYGKNGFRATISDFGGIIWSLMVPDKTGRLTDVVAGYDSVEDLEASSGYLGALIGRFGNRIANARFALDGVEYALYQNDGENHLHGGKIGYDRCFWTVECEDGEQPALHLSYLCSDTALMHAAAEEARQTAARDPSLSLPAHAPLRAEVERLFAIEESTLS